MIQLEVTRDRIRASDGQWLTLGELRKLVKMADENGWSDGCLVSHGYGEPHPILLDVNVAKSIIVEGPS